MIWAALNLWRWPLRIVWAVAVFLFVMLGVMPFAITGMILREIGEEMCRRVGA